MGVVLIRRYVLVNAGIVGNCRVIRRFGSQRGVTLARIVPAVATVPTLMCRDWLLNQILKSHHSAHG